MESEHKYPPGFRFYPSDEELIAHYLQNKVTSRPIPASVVAEIDLYKYNPWELPKKASFGEDEWYFFSPRDRKYPNGVRPNRAAGSGYWKARGTDKPVLTGSGSKIVGVKKTLVFYIGRPPKGAKTGWIVNEYRLPSTSKKPSKSKGSMRLDDWVLCRVRQKGITSRNTLYETEENPGKESVRCLSKMEDARPMYTNYNPNMISDCSNQEYQLLASILGGQPLPPINETISCVTFQGSNKDNSFTSGYENCSVMLNSPVAVSSSNNCNLAEQKHNEEDRYVNVLELSDRNEFCNSNTSDPIRKFLELNELTFAAKYLQ